MSSQKIQFSCSRSLILTNLHPDRNFKKSILDVGFYNGDLYQSYLYFKSDDSYENYMIISAILRLYVKKQISNGMTNILYIYPLEQKFNRFTTFNNMPEVSNEFIEFNIHDCDKWLDIDITSLFDNNDNILKNGMLLKSNGDANSLVRFYSNLVSNYKIVPKLFLEYYTENNFNDGRYVEVRKRVFILDFEGEEVTQPINVERMIQGTFFINNLSTSDLNAKIEVSFDLSTWVGEQEVNVSANSNDVLVAQYYGKYYRVVLSSPGNTASVEIKFIYQVYK